MNIQISITALLLGVAKADEKIEKHELQIITDILTDFSSPCHSRTTNSLLDTCLVLLEGFSGKETVLLLRCN